MRVRVSIILAIALAALGITAPSSSDAGACRRQTAQNCFELPATLNFSSVGEISHAIVSGEPKTQSPQKPAIELQPAPEPYTGPMIGINSHVGAPTIGYYWSIH